jgi:hypothetical protein
MEFEAGKVMAAPFLGGGLGVEKKIRIISKIRKAEFIKPGREQANDICEVNDLEDMNPEASFVLAVSAIMKSEIEKQFPNAKYVGECFAFTRYAKSQGGKASPIRLQHLKVKAK